MNDANKNSTNFFIRDKERQKKISPFEISAKKNKLKISIQCKKKEHDPKPKEKLKVKTEAIKNIDNQGKIIQNEKEVIVNIRLQLNPITKNISRTKDRMSNTDYNAFSSLTQAERNGFKYALGNYDRFCDNYLTMRKTLNLFDSENIKKINMSKNPYYRNAKNKKNHIEIINENHTAYPKYFFPSAGYGLLINK